jgi:MFS family permease
MPSTASEQYDHFIDINRGRNFVANMLEMSFWTLAMSFVLSSTVLPLYASYLTASTVLIGLMSSANEVSFYIPQLFSASRIERLAVKKPFVIRVTLMERLPFFFVAIPLFLWPGAPKMLSYAVLLFSLALAQGSGGLAAPAWKAMLAKVISSERRGLLFSLGSAFGGLLGIAGALLARYVLVRYSYPISFGICFALAGSANMVSWLCMFFIKEPAKEPETEHPPILKYLRELPNVLRTNPNYSRYLTSQFLVIFGGMGLGFYVLFAKTRFAVDDGFVANMTMAALVTQSGGIPLLGWLSDRKGHTWLGKLGAILGALSAAVIIAAPEKNWMYAVFILANLSRECLAISRKSITMEFCDPDRLPTYTALSSALLAAPMLVAPVIGGWVIKMINYQSAFVASALFYVAGWLVLQRLVRDPRIDCGGTP